MAKPHILGVTVNQGTSLCVEVMIRTLFRFNDLSNCKLRLHVVDNASADDDLPALKQLLTEQDIPLIPSGMDDQVWPEKHGMALSRFVLSHPDCDYYLFLDSDIYFDEPNVLPDMLQTIEAAPDAFGIMPRIWGVYAKRFIEPYAEPDGEAFFVDMANPDHPERTWRTQVASRLSPVCCLLRNQPILHRIIAEFGLSQANFWLCDDSIIYDTCSHLTHVMAVIGQRRLVSARTIRHFTNTTHRPQWKPMRDTDCRRILRTLEAGEP